MFFRTKIYKVVSLISVFVHYAIMSTYTNYSKLEVDGTISSSVQGELIGTFTTMPKASALNEGKTIYYTGATSGNYVQNTFYTCVNNSGTYTWTSASPKQVSVDSALSATSTNPVQNKVISNALSEYAKKEDISTAYKAKGSIASANLPSNPSVGDVYDLTDASSYGPVGTNVVWTGTKWDALAGITDLSGKQDKLTAGTGISLGSNNTISLATSGVTAGSKGSSTQVPVITVDAYGRITSISTSTIYPPTSAGTSGQIWVSDGSGQGVWQSKDTTPTSGSTNAITSGAVHSELAKKQNNLTFDSAPTSASNNPVTSGGVYTALQAKQNNLTFDSTPTNGSSNPVTSGGVYSAINGKQDKLTFDNTPTSGSNNPVKSSGIFTAINGKQDKLTFDSAPVSGSNNPVTSGGVYSAINSVEQKVPSGGIAGQVWVSDGEGAGVWADPSSVGSSYSIVQYNSYQYPVPVMAGDEYSTNGGKTWTKVQNNGQINAPFSGLVRYHGICEGNMPITKKEVIRSGSGDLPSKNYSFRNTKLRFVLKNKLFLFDGTGEHSGLHTIIYDINGNFTDLSETGNYYQDCATFALATKGFRAGGHYESSSGKDSTRTDVFMYDENGNRTIGTALPGKKEAGFTFVLNGKGYLYGGKYVVSSSSSSYSTNDSLYTYIYDDNGNVSNGRSITKDRNKFNYAFTIGNKGFKAWDNNSTTMSFEMYDVNGNATTLSNTIGGHPVTYFVLKNKAYLPVSQKFVNSSWTITDEVKTIDTNGNITDATPLSVARIQPSAGTIGDLCGVVLGSSTGRNSDYYYKNYNSNVDIYDANGIRTNGTPMNNVRMFSEVFDLGGRMLELGGRLYTSDSSFQVPVNTYAYDYKVYSHFPLTKYSEYKISSEYNMATADTTKTISKIVRSSTESLDTAYKIKYQNGII